MPPIPLLPPGAVWHRTGTRVFRHAAPVGTTWWVLRLNAFPDHPLFTLFIDGRCVGDLDMVPDQWRTPQNTTVPALTPRQLDEVLSLMAGLGPYDSENGRPCAGDWCGCDVRTDEYAARRDPPPSTN